MTAASKPPSPGSPPAIRSASLGSAGAAVTLALFLSAPGAWAGPADSPSAWLQRMGHSMQTLSYTGTFVYVHNGRMEAMRIVHARDENGQRERLISLNGEPREVIRNDETVTCIRPGSRSIEVSKSRPRNPLPVALSEDLGRLDQGYQLEFAGEERVAGLPARIIAIRPVDRMRYGYRLWIDRDNHLLLRSDMTDESGRPVEQVMFTDLRIIDSVPDEFFSPVLSGSGYTWHRDEAVPVATDGDDLRWQVAGLPPGFRLTAFNRKSHNQGEGQMVDHLVYSDGLASLSVFIEPAVAGASALDGESRMGAVNAYGHRYDTFNVTVVGEVPVETLRQVGESVSARR